MCWSEAPIPTAEEIAKIHFCQKHPNVSLGRRHYIPFASAYEHYCMKCLANTIAAIPTQAAEHPDWFGDNKVDPITIQIVLDTLDQKLGIVPD